MIFLKFLWQFLLALLFGWIAALKKVYVWFKDYLKWRKEEKRKSHSDKNAARTSCTPIEHPSFHRPDPMIYSQNYLMSLGLAVTWNNPDIQLFIDKTAVSSELIQKDADYTVMARIWNNSQDAPIVAMPVHFFMLSFGIGAERKYIGSTTVDLGVKGGPNHPAFAQVPWHTPNVPGHYCLQVQLAWDDDINPMNNLGQENTNVGELHSPAEFTFQLRNETDNRQEYLWVVDTYKILDLPLCETTRGTKSYIKNLPFSSYDAYKERRERKREAQERHNPANFPIPTGWNIEITPNIPVLKSKEVQPVSVRITAPEGWVGSQVFNVNAFYKNKNNILGYSSPAGGVSLQVIGK